MEICKRQLKQNPTEQNFCLNKGGFMYKPEYTQTSVSSQISDVIKNNPFITLISVSEAGNPFISHIPVVSEFQDGRVVAIRGHLALKNPHVKILQTRGKVTAVFHGPHTYISPLWYKSGRDVPTWNYCVVNVEGELKLEADFESICTNLKELTAEFEGPSGWQFELPDDLNKPELLTRAIVAFTIVPALVNSKFKLSQNRALMDRNGVIEGLSQRTDDQSREIKKLMEQSLQK